MNVSFSSVTEPVYANADHTAINCMVVVSEDSDHAYAGQEHPFTARADDFMPYGAALWQELIAGDHGVIAPYVAPTLTPAQRAQEAIATGVVVSSLGTPELNGVYPIDASTQVKINNVITYLMLNSAFPPGNSSSLPWYDMAGDVHVFTSASDFKNFATALADFIAHVDIYASSNGALGSIPSNAITIP